MPPATMTCASPARIAWAASMTACRPEPHTRLTAIAPTVSGTPPLSAACRAGAWPRPAETTLPRITSSMSEASMRLRSSAARIAIAPSSGALRPESPPRKRPIGVRAAPTITAVRCGSAISMGSCFCCSRSVSWGPAPPGRGQRRIIGKRDSRGQPSFPFFLHCGRGGGWRARARRVALAALAGGGTAGHGGCGMPDLGSLILFPTRYSSASLWLRPCRSALRLLDQRQLSVLLADPPPCDRRVVLEDQEPVLLLRALHDRALRFQRHERLDIIAHDPRERQVRTGGHDVGKKDRGLACGLDEDGLVMRGVARRAQHGNAGDDLDVPFDQVELPRVHDRVEVVLEVARLDALVLPVRVLPLPLLHDVACARE